MKKITPDFAPVFPPAYADDVAAAVTIGQPRPGRVLMRVDLAAYGAPDLVVRVNAPLARVAHRAAVRWARIHHYGPTRRITEITIRWIHQDLAAAAK